MRRGGTRQGGFALVEALVALAILAMSLGFLFQVIADSAHRTLAATDKRAALLVAQSKLAMVGTVYRPGQGPMGGIDGPFEWWIEGRSLGREESDAGALWSVTVGVRMRNGGPVLVTLRSLRVAPVV